MRPFFLLIVALCQIAFFRISFSQQFRVETVSCADTDFAEKCLKVGPDLNKYSKLNYTHISYFEPTDSQYYHYMFSVLNGPALLLFHSDEDCTLNVNYSKIIDGDFPFSISLISNSTKLQCKMKNQHLLEKVYIEEFVEKEIDNPKILQFHDLTKEDFIDSDSILECRDKNSCIYKHVYSTDKYMYELTFSSGDLKQKAAPYTYLGPLGINVRFDINNLTVMNYESKLLSGYIISHANIGKQFEGKMKRFYSDDLSPSVFSSYDLKYKDQTEDQNNFTSFWHNVAFTDTTLRRVSQILAKYNSTFNSNKFICSPVENGLNYFMQLNLKNSHCYEIVFDILNYDNFYYNTKYIRSELYFGFKKYFYYKTPSVVITVTVAGVVVPLVLFSITVIVVLKIRKNQKQPLAIHSDEIIIGSDEVSAEFIEDDNSSSSFIGE